MKDDFAKLGLVQGSSLLAIAPHPDDVTLSCGGLMRQMAEVDITLLTCFSRSLYAPLADIVALTVEIVQAIRKSEDENYARRIKANYVDLALDDVSLRYADPDDWLCENPVLDETYVRLTEEINHVLRYGHYTHIVCPLAVGHHIDHIYARDAIRRTAWDHQQILYYEDLPYGVRIGGPAAVCDYAHVTIPYGESVKIDITSVIERKMADIGIYKSQIYPSDLAGVVRYAAELGKPDRMVERVWFKSRQFPLKDRE